MNHDKSKTRLFVRWCKHLFMAVALAASAAGCEKAAEQARTDARPRTRVVLPETRRFEDKTPVQGTVRAKTSILVSARVPGTLDALLAAEGAHVKSGAPLFRIDRSNLVNAVRSAENEIAVAKAAVAQSKASLEKAAADRLRMSKVVGTGGVSQRDFEQSVFAEKTAEAQLAAAEALLSKTETGLAVAKKNLSDSEALAPFDGTITRKLKDVGDYVAPGTPVFAMEDDAPCEVRFSLDASRYGAVLVGETKIGGDTIFWKSPTIDSATRTFEVRTRAPRSSGLKPGMLVDAEAVFASFDAPAVPSSAVNPMPDGTRAVFTVENGKIVRRNVTVAAESGGWTAIRAGELPKDAQVVADGMLLLHEDDEVVAVED